MTAPLPLVLGTVQIGVPYGVANERGLMGEAEAQDFLAYAWDLGYRTLDTAQAYGVSEERIGRFFKQRPEKPFAAITKIPSTIDLSSTDAIETCMRSSLDRLGEPIAGVLLHHGQMLQAWGGPLGKTLERLHHDGAIRHLGVSLYSSDEFKDAMEIQALRWVQIPFNIFDQGLARKGLLAAAEASGRRLFVRSVFLQGLLVMRPEIAKAKVPGAADYLDRWWKLVKASGRSASSVAFHFVRAVLPGADLIVGCETREQLEMNARLVGEPPLDTALVSELLSFGDVPEVVASPRFWKS